MLAMFVLVASFLVKHWRYLINMLVIGGLGVHLRTPNSFKYYFCMRRVMPKCLECRNDIPTCGNYISVKPYKLVSIYLSAIVMCAVIGLCMYVCGSCAKT